MKIALFASIFFAGCASTQKDNLLLKENWIDDNDLQYVLAHPNVRDWFSQFGNPVVTEYSNDTVFFVYNYHPALFKTAKNGIEYKPTGSDRMENIWGARNEFIALLIRENKLIGIQKAEKYNSGQDLKQAELVSKSNESKAWIVLAALAAVGAIALFIFSN